MQAGAGSRPGPSPPPQGCGPGPEVDSGAASDKRLTPGETAIATEQEPSPDADPCSAPTRPEHAASASAASTTTTATPLLEKILSRVKMLGRSRPAPTPDHPVIEPATPLRAARSSTAEATGAPISKAGGGGTPATAARRAASEVVAVAPPADGHGPGAQQGRAAMEVLDSDGRSVLSTASLNCILTNLDSAPQGYKEKDLRLFCEQLERFLDNIRSMPDLNHIIYNYPSILQGKLDEEAKKVHFMLMEARAAHLRILQVKTQRQAVRKGTRDLEKSLALIKDEEASEMENYIALYDKSLMTRWEKIRGSTQDDVVDSFVHDIKRKQKALDYLHTLATNKLNQLRSHGKQALNEDSKPISLALRRLSAGGGTRGSSARWRNKQHERAMRAPSTPLAQDTNLTIQAAPSAGAPSNLTINPGFVGTSGEVSSRTSFPTTFGSTSSSVIPNITPPINMHVMENIATGAFTATTPERRSVLQALFTDIQHPGTHDNLPITAVMPRLVGASSAAGRIGGNNEEESQNENSSPGNDIELFTMQDHS